MHLLGLSAAVATLLQLAIALPTTDLESRAEANILVPTTVGLYLCVDADWKPPCVHLKNGPGLCINLNSTFASQVSSVGPDKEVSGCAMFEKSGCQGTQLQGIKYPGEANLAARPEGNKFNDLFSSYICY